jgi:ribosomal protein S18 acetylase RimI-like enzyme
MDLLVRLYALDPKSDLDARLIKAGVTIRRALPPEFGLVTSWVREKFDDRWASETTVAFTRQPPSCFLAVRDGKLIGFACYDATARGFFGPTGVDKAARGVGVGHGLLLASLLDMRAQGYGYGIIGGAGPVDFYVRSVNAVPIEGSIPGIYAGLLEAPD